MSKSRARLAFDLLAAAGVVGSLIFVGLEVRQNTAAVRGATYQAISDASVGSAEWLATDEYIRALMVRVTQGAVPDDFSEEDNLAVAGIYYSIIRRIENVYLQVNEGLISQTAYQHFRPGRGAFLAAPYFALVWPRYRNDFASDFVRFFEREYVE